MCKTDKSSKMTKMQEDIFEVENFLEENYEFRRNVLSGKTEVCVASNGDQNEWQPITAEVMNSIVRHAKKEGVGSKTSPRRNIEEYVNSNAIKTFDPVYDYLSTLPEWDGHNHVADLFGRLPGLTTEQLGWCAVWLRSAVAHWLGMDMLHGNECVPILIGKQGCGKSTFAVRLLPPTLREYYLDHINFGNKFDSEMALTHNLLVNIDEFANMRESQQGKLKQTLSKVKVNGRPIFGRSQEDRRRYASFLATTNDERPLCDPTGSRRYLCIRITPSQMIDNLTPIHYDQLFAQVIYELKVEHAPYWFSNSEVERIQQTNAGYVKSDDLESLFCHCYSINAKDSECEWTNSNDIVQTLQSIYPSLMTMPNIKVKLGKALRYLGCKVKHTEHGQAYLVSRKIA